MHFRFVKIQALAAGFGYVDGRDSPYGLVFRMGWGSHRFAFSWD
jgi:hypothetical protein